MGKLYVAPYKHLKDEEFIYVRNSGEEPVCVVQIEYKQGLTVKYMNPEIEKQNDNNCICVNKSTYKTEEEYNKRFNAYVKAIKTGRIAAGTVAPIGYGMQSCAFM